MCDPIHSIARLTDYKLNEEKLCLFVVPFFFFSFLPPFLFLPFVEYQRPLWPIVQWCSTCLATASFSARHLRFFGSRSLKQYTRILTLLITRHRSYINGILRAKTVAVVLNLAQAAGMTSAARLEGMCDDSQ